MGRQQGRQADRKRGQQGAGTKAARDDTRQLGEQNVYGEGNYAASRQYNEATKAFAASGRVESSARDAEPRSDADAMQMAAAEAEGKRRARGEDPALERKGSQQQPPESRTPRPGEEEE